MGKKICQIPSIRPEEKPTDVLTEVLRAGCQDILKTALEFEIGEFLERYKDLRTSEGRQRITRNGHHRAREIQTGVGDVTAKVPRAWDQEAGKDGIKFSSKLLPPYLRRTQSIEDLLPWLYLKGLSTGDFSDALVSILGAGAGGLSPASISRLKSTWENDYRDWGKRSLASKEYVYIWADGVYLKARMESQKQCLLVIMGSTPSGKKELIAIHDGYRESEQSWTEVLEDLRHRGLKMAPKLATGDGALGFWKALAKVYPETRVQRCWVHKTANILNKLPKSSHPKAKAAIKEIWMAENRAEAKKALQAFVAMYGAKYPKAAKCLVKDEDVLLTFYDFPADHWKHIRTSNPIESTFATVRLRTARTRGCLSRTTALTMVFRLCLCAEKRWRRLTESALLGKVVEGIVFTDGVEDAAA